MIYSVIIFFSLFFCFSDEGLVNLKRVDKKIKFIKTVPDRLFRPSSPFKKLFFYTICI